MTQEQIQNLYQSFVQADSSTTRKFGGTGLGLAISKQLSEMLGGDLECESVLNEGTLFTLTISVGDLESVDFYEDPRAAMKALHAANQDESNARGLAKNQSNGICSILLAEDGIDNQRLISTLLKKEGAQVRLVENGEIAVRCAMDALENGKPFDVILMDMSMPVLDGYGAARKLREKGYQYPIVALTAHAMNGDREKCIEAGCTDYATKPVNRAKLRKLVQTYQSTNPVPELVEIMS